MLRKSVLAVITVIGMISLSVPAMAATNAPAGNTAFTLSKETLKDMDKTMYVTADLLNVRDIPSMEGDIIGGIGYGDSVTVTGQKEKNGEDPGWFRIALDDMSEGFVSAEFLADDAPEPIALPEYTYAAAPAAYTAPAYYTAPAATTQTAAPAAGTAISASGAPIIKTSYVYAQSGSLVKIQKDANGNWTYGDGNSLTWVTDYEAVTDGGEALTSYDPSNIEDLAGYLATVE